MTSNGGPGQIHPTAIIDPGVSIGAGTTIWHHVHVRSGVGLGRDCIVGKNVYLDAGVQIGDRVKIQNNVNVYSGVTIADDVFLGPSCVFTNDLFPRASSAAWTIVATDVGQGASVGANATIVCGTTIGSWAMVAAGSVVTRDVADHQLVRGNPARPAGWVCTCGRIASRETERPLGALVCETCADAQARGPERARGATGW